jgi:hypothetical protein
MSAIDLVTNNDLAQARLDPAFRQQLLAENLELLLRELNKLRRFEANELCAARRDRPPAGTAVPQAAIPCLSGETPYKPRFRSTPAGS